MTKLCINVFIALLILLVCAAASVGQEQGSISGTVQDEGGLLIAGARVNAALLNGRPTTKLERYVETDLNGHFLIDRLEWGNYGVFAMREESAYPDMGASFYSNDVFPKAEITPWSPNADVRIQLGPKAGIITGSIINAKNGAPLNSAIKFFRAESKDKWLSTSTPPAYRILVPSSTDVLMEVSAPGFTTWTPGQPLRMGPGAEMRLDIQLEPSHDPNLHPSQFLVPEGYVGWLLLEYNLKGAQPVPEENEVKTFKFPANGALNTSSSGPQRGAEDRYFYYLSNGSSYEIPTDYRNGKGMIWGQHEGTRDGTLAQFGFFVGTEEQYRKFRTRMTHPGPIPTQLQEVQNPQ